MTTEGAGAELVEVVDESGAVVEVVTRAAMRARNLRHRSTFVVVVTTAGHALSEPGISAELVAVMDRLRG